MAEIVRHPAGTVMGEGQRVPHLVRGHGSSAAWDWQPSQRSNCMMRLNTLEYFFRALAASYGRKEAWLVMLDAGLVEGKFSGEIFAKIIRGRDLELNVENWASQTFRSSQVNSESFHAFVRPDGVLIYHTITCPLGRFRMRMIEDLTPRDDWEKCLAWLLPAIAHYNSELKVAFLTSCFEHGYCSWAVWDPRIVTPEKPIPTDGGEAFQKFGKVPEFTKGRSFGPYYRDPPYIRKDTIIPPSVDTNLYRATPDSPMPF